MGKYRVFCLGTLICWIASDLSLARADSPPNIVLIVADDLGWTDVGFIPVSYLAQHRPELALDSWKAGKLYYQTPAIDRIARSGVMLTSFYACQNCAPTRAALMSGQYAPRTGVYTVGTLARGREQDRKLAVPQNNTRLPLNCRTIAELLRDRGYATAIFGKWHLGGQGPFHPLRRGFDEAAVSMGRYYNFRVSPPRPVPEGAYLTDYLTDLAVDFIERHKTRPFFLYLAHFAVHVPLQAKPALLDRFRKREPVGGHNNPTYAAMIASLDESVGRVLETLDRLNLQERTLVVFTSDNGGVGGYRVPGQDVRKGITDNWPLREGKGSLYEGGIRVPFAACWPGQIPAGTIREEPAHVVDLLPTFLEVAGIEPPADYVLDGASILPLLGGTGDREATAPRALYWHMPGYLQSYIPERKWRTTPVSVIREGPWKLLRFYETGREELYNLDKDLGEADNVLDKQPGVAGRLSRLLDQWLSDTGALLPQPKKK